MSGHSCPYAKDCQSAAVETSDGWRIKDGQHTKFRCFSASEEALYTSVRKARLNNMKLVELAAQDKLAAFQAIDENMPKKCEILRIHVGGDFKTQAYFDVWLAYATVRQDVLFYAYTKSLPFWIKRLGDIPKNFLLTASRGGHRDNLISEHALREAIVVNPALEGHEILDVHTALVDGQVYEIDHDDYHAATVGGSFALVLHGRQPANSAAAAGIRQLKGFGSYNKENGANLALAS